LNLENACATGSTAFREAYLAVRSGLYDLTLVLGIEHMSVKGGGFIDPNMLRSIEAQLGFVAPAHG